MGLVPMSTDLQIRITADTFQRRWCSKRL